MTDTDTADTEPSSPPMPGAINGTCVEPGQNFLEHYTCEGVEGPTPTQPPVSAAAVDHNPQTLEDPDYAWVQAQAAACSCICCHREGGIGSYKWSYDFEPAFIDSADAGPISLLGFASGPTAVPPEDNHGFSRSRSALPTTDADRLQGFFDRELQRRGL
jgi:hypothetical protein